MKTRIAILSLPLLAALPLTAIAATGFYVGGTIGHRETDQDDVVTTLRTLAEQEYASAFPEPGPPAVTSLDIVPDVDEAGLGWKAFVGWAPHEYTFFEAGFMDLGKSSVTMDIDATFDTLPPMSESFTFKQKFRGGFLTAGIKYPLSDRIELFGKIGGLLYTGKGEFSGTLVGVDTSTFVSPSDNDGSTLMYGLGARYLVTDQFAVRAEWEYIEELGDLSAHIFSLGAEFYFDAD